MITPEELVDIKIKYLNCVKRTISDLKIPKVESGAGNRNLTETMGSLKKRLENVVDQEYRCLNLELKYYIARRLKESNQTMDADKNLSDEAT